MQLIRCAPKEGQGLEETGKPMTLKSGAVSQSYWDSSDDVLYERVQQADGRVVWYRLED